MIPYASDDDAARIANDSPYGLSGGAWSGDPARALRVARLMRTASMAINGSYPPFPLEPRPIGLPSVLHPANSAFTTPKGSWNRCFPEPRRRRKRPACPIALTIGPE
jgi:hypothetical protein